MKKLTTIILVCCFMMSFNVGYSKKGNTDKNSTEQNAKIKGKDKAALSDTSRQKFIRLLNSQENCCASTDPGVDTCALKGTTDCTTIDNYCNGRCTNKVICCHRIPEALFNELTHNKKDGHATFSLSEFENIVSNANCRTQYILLSIKRRRYFINSRNDMTSMGRDHESFHSVAFMQGIYNDPRIVRQVKLYRGKQLDPATNIVPFMVEFANDETEYFDLSDSQP